MIALPSFTALQVTNYRLFPGAPRGSGIDFRFAASSSLIVGINGLGKTTLVNMLFRLLVGPFDLPKDEASRSFGGAARTKAVPWPGRRRYFSQRVPDRASGATAALTFSLNGRDFRVVRDLSSCRLVEASIGQQKIAVSATEAEYQDVLVRESGVGNFADFLTLAKYLTFFNEERRDVLWDHQAQRQFFRMLFLTANDSRDWSTLETEIAKQDSMARNLSSVAFRLRRELRDLETAFLENAGVGEALSIKQTLLDADLQRKQELEEQLGELDAELKETRRTLERSKIFADEAEQELEAIRYGALNRLFPTLDDTAKYILTHLFSEGRCLACEADAPDEQRRFSRSLVTGDCAICGADRKQQRRLPPSETVAPPVEVERRRLERARDALTKANMKRLADAAEEERLTNQRGSVLDELARRSVAIQALQADSDALRARLPPTPEDLQNRQKAVDGMYAEEKRAEARRAVAELEYGKLIERMRERIQAATARIASHFSPLATNFLEEECSLTFRMVTGRPSQNGENFEYPSLKFEMTAAAFEGRQIRDTPADVSESQREFIDLAFRMALMIVATDDGPVTLVMETPEASLDVIFMEKAAELLNGFATNGRKVVVTSNLTNSALIPALIGGALHSGETISGRWSRVLNLLEVAEPNAALRNFRHQYEEFLRNAVEAPHATA